MDKACIDQTSIDANLAALPVFLSGCESLLVLAGATYPSRLWCIVELFVFLRVGHSRDRIDIRPLGDEDVEAMIATFDANKARCFLEHDRERLLAVVEAGFGDIYAFNQSVKALMQKPAKVRV